MSAAAQSETLPFHLRGNFAPLRDEVTLTQLAVDGALPRELCGLYVRTGPNPRSGTSPHWFLGDGMVHGVRLENGAARWYRNRWVRTRSLAEPSAPRVSPTGQIDRTLSKANTHVLGHAGRIWALEEGSFPYLLDRELATVGCTDFGGRLTSAFTAHPKACPKTGELLGFGYGQFPPYFTYHRVSPQGELVQSEAIQLPGPTMMHDFAITERYAIVMDLPVVFDLQQAMRGGMPFRWSDEYGARLGVLPRTGSNADVRWFEIEPCYVFHTVNAYEEGSQIVLDASRYDSLWRRPGDFASNGRQTLHRFTLDLAGGGVKEETLDERATEFPRVADARVGSKHRYAYMTLWDVSSLDAPAVNKLMKTDAQTGKTEVHDFGAQRHPGEPVFVPAAGSGSDEEGYVITYVYDDATETSDLVVLDASRFSAAPIATVRLPRRIPYGFHGSWIAD
jgi:carotenoid cleavage dioxygenase